MVGFVVEGISDRSAGSGRGAPSVEASVAIVAEPGPWRHAVEEALQAAGYALAVSSGGTRTVAAVPDADVAIVHLAVRQPKGIDVVCSWRRGSTIPIIAVAGSAGEDEVLDAYAAGADHVAPPDVTGALLLARVRSTIRRSGRRWRPPPAHASDADDLVLAPDNGVVIGGIRVELAPAEFAVLRLLVERDGRLVTRGELAALVAPGGTRARAIDFLVRRVRQKTEQVDGRRRIVVVRGVGFRLDVDMVHR